MNLEDRVQQLERDIVRLEVMIITLVGRDFDALNAAQQTISGDPAKADEYLKRLEKSMNEIFSKVTVLNNE